MTTTTAAAIRAEALDDLKKLLAEHRKKQPNVRSMMLCCGQYWADEADDAVHSHVIASERATPIWPHPCDVTYDEDLREAMPGESCWSCQGNFDYLSWDSNGSAIEGFAEFCTEDGSQEESSAHSYRPYAIARVRDGSDEIEVELVGVRQRVGAEMIAQPKQAASPLPWPDPRAEDLFLQVCANARDDGPREVLRDHLLEKGDPRGEYLSSLDPALLAQHRAAWLGPLACVIPEGEAIFERGFLAHAQAYADDDSDASLVKGARQWGTVETLWIHTTSAALLDHAMIALREVGVLYPVDLDTLASAPRPWSIEAMHVMLDDETYLGQLAALTTVPKLRRLTIAGNATKSAVAWLARSPLAAQLERVTLLAVERLVPPADAPFACATALQSPDDNDRPCGWELAVDPRTGALEVSHAGYHPEATLDELATLVATTLPAGEVICWRPTRTWQPTEDDLAKVSAKSGRTLSL